MQCSPLAANQQFRLVNSSLLVLTLATMVTQHKYKPPRRLKIRFDWYHCKELSLCHSPNLITALVFSNRQRSQSLHTLALSKSELYTLSRTLLSYTIPPNWLQWQPLWVCRLQSTFSIFRQLNGLPRSNHRVYRVHGDGTPSSCSRLQSALASSFQAVAKGFETSLSRLLRTARRGSQIPVRILLVVRHGIQPRVRQQAVTVVACSYTTNRTIERRSGGTERHSRSSQDAETITSQTGSVTTFTCCNKEHQSQCTCVLYTSADLTDL